MELSLIWLFVFPRHFRIGLFYLVTLWQLGVIATANYAFLNYLVLAMGVLIVDDRFLLKFVPVRWRSRIDTQLAPSTPPNEKASIEPVSLHAQLRQHFAALKIAITAVMLTWIFYATTVEMIFIITPRLPFPMAPVALLEPFRIANQYGLFAVMTRGRYEIEFQGSNDGQNWTPYRFRYKPQAVNEGPGIYAPYQPRFDWNLWFASLGSWRSNLFVPKTEVRLLENDRDVLGLFAGNPFAQAPPKQVRAVLWQYWFTTMAEKRATGNWWRRQLIGVYAPTLERRPDGKIDVVEMPPEASPQP
jgi:lipase maturation factor 1